MSPDLPSGRSGSPEQAFEHVLSQARFEGLKAILDLVSQEREVLHAAILGADTYEQLLAKL
ncbi:MAG TPA: hypothetical protein VJA21_11370, partial [Verrucomicrobiae bacterium]